MSIRVFPRNDKHRLQIDFSEGGRSTFRYQGADTAFCFCTSNRWAQRWTHLSCWRQRGSLVKLGMKLHILRSWSYLSGGNFHSSYLGEFMLTIACSKVTSIGWRQPVDLAISVLRPSNPCNGRDYRPLLLSALRCYGLTGMKEDLRLDASRMSSHDFQPYTSSF